MEETLKKSLITATALIAVAVAAGPVAAGKSNPVKGPVSYGLTSSGSLVKFKLRGKGKSRVVGSHRPRRR